MKQGRTKVYRDENPNPRDSRRHVLRVYETGRIYGHYEWMDELEWAVERRNLELVEKSK